MPFHVSSSRQDLLARRASQPKRSKRHLSEGIHRPTDKHIPLDLDRRFQKTRKTTARMGGLCEERSEKGRGGKKWREKANNRDKWKQNYKSSRTAERRVDQPHPLHKGNQRKNKNKISGKESSKGIFEGFLKGFSCNCMNILFANLSFAELGQESRSAIITRSYYNVQQICKQSHGLMGY